MADPLPFRGAIFDLDGTLLDSMHVWSDIDVKFLHKRGLSVPPGYGAAIAPLTFRETSDYNIEFFHLNEKAEDIMAEWDRMAIDEYSHHVELKPHAKAYLQYLWQQGIRLGICTSNTPKLYTPALQRHGIFDWFDTIVGTDEAKRGKSFPEPFLLTAERLGLPPQDCIVFEDIPAAVRGALAAGMQVYGVYDKAAHDQEAEMRQLTQRFLYDFGELLPQK